MSDSLRPHGLQPARLPCPWDSPGKNIVIGCHGLLQEIFQTQGSNPHFFISCNGRQVLYHQHHLERLWVHNLKKKKKRIAKSYKNTLLNILRICQTFPKSYTFLHSHQQHMRVPISSHSHQDLQLSFCYSHLLTMKSYLTGVLICISLVTNATEHHFKCLLAMNLLWRNDYSDAVSIF